MFFNSFWKNSLTEVYRLLPWGEEITDLNHSLFKFHEFSYLVISGTPFFVLEDQKQFHA